MTGLPADVTQTKLRQYFKDYGHINSVSALAREPDGQSSTALIEFRTAEEARSALLRDAKYLGQSQISVQSGRDLTVYVANFPPAADEAYMRRLFGDCGEMLSLRWPSLKVNSHRRFCYVSFRDREASAKAVAKEGTLLEGKYSLVSKYSDPAAKKSRQGAVAEGREVHVSNLDRALAEADVREAFSKYGTLTRVNIPLTLAGKNRGFAYLDFETHEQAQRAAEEMNNAKFRSQILAVEVSRESRVKHAATTVYPGRAPASSSSSSSSTAPPLSADDIAARTIALMGLPDTVNDARVRALVEPHGDLVRLVLQPAHGGARVEFADAAAAGRASLALDGSELEGRRLRTGSADELRHARAEHTHDRIVYGARGRDADAPAAAAAAAKAAPANGLPFARYPGPPPPP